MSELVKVLGDNAPFGMIEAVIDSGENQTTTAPPLDDTKSPSTDDLEQQPNQTPRQKQHSAILAVIALKGFDAMVIPVGERGTIEAICRADYSKLFKADSSFDTAWKKGRHLFKMANHDDSTKRGNN